MNRTEILEAPAIAYYSGWGGIEITGMVYGINDSIEYRAPAWWGKPKAHRTRIYYDGKNTYFKYNGHRIPLSECIRVDHPSEIVRRIG